MNLDTTGIPGATSNAVQSIQRVSEAINRFSAQAIESGKSIATQLEGDLEKRATLEAISTEVRRFKESITEVSNCCAQTAKSFECVESEVEAALAATKAEQN